MTDAEFDIIDELYFVTAYNDLKEATEFSDEMLKTNLVNMVKQGWIRVYKSVNEESELGKLNLENDFQSYFYLASKKGLFEHNTQ
ncbi:transporter [Ekhidna sp. To15]|uniref:transporter n=1 Tax=Ekhidna sp. To15 TaxID=3395267 RepID=UPI003F52407E